ncbi:hypothetical protein [Rhizobium gallicum]|nr:hypothetical protein [Rhizobium gallicum]
MRELEHHLTPVDLDEFGLQSAPVRLVKRIADRQSQDLAAPLMRPKLAP